MCILFIHTNPDPQENEYRLIVASNRDEYFRRPAKAAFRCPKTGVIAGRDMEPGKEGGTWLGFATKSYPEDGKSTKHCFSCLTNIIGVQVENATARGGLVVDYLEGSMDYPEYVNDLKKRGLQYDGYNLMAVEISKDGSTTVYYHSNIPQIDSVYKGKHTVSFGDRPISAPLMKVVNGKEIFLDIIEKGLKKDQLIEELLAFLKSNTKHLPDRVLERSGPKAEEIFSSVYVHYPDIGFGTRTHTIILLDKDWNLEFQEISMEEPINPEEPKWNTTVIKAQL